METTRERSTSRLPAWARGWPRRRVAGRRGRRRAGRRPGGQLRWRCRWPDRRARCWPTARTSGVTGVRSPSDRTGGTLRVVAPADRQPRPAAVLPARRVEPDAALHPHAGHLLLRAGRDRPARPRPGDRPGHAVGGRPELDVHPPRGGALRDRAADHRRATSSTGSSGPSPPTSSSAARPTSWTCSTTRPTPTPARTRTRRRTGSAWPPSRPPTTARSSSGSAHRSRTSRSSWRCPRAARCPSSTTAARRLRERPRLLRPVRHHVRRRGDRHPPGAQRPSGTRPPTTCGPPCPTGSSSGPGCRASSGTRRCSPVRPTSTSPGPACSRPRRPGWRSEEDNPLRERVDDLTTGAVRMLALPTDVAPMDNPACRTAVAAAVDRRGGAGGAQPPGQRGAQLPAVATGARRRARGRPTRGPTWPPPGPRSQECGQPDGFATVLAVPDTQLSVKVAEEVAGQLAEVGIQAEVRPLDAATFYATDVGNPGERGGQRLRHHPHHLDGGLPDARVVPGAARRRTHHPRRSATPTTPG